MKEPSERNPCHFAVKTIGLFFAALFAGAVYSQEQETAGTALEQVLKQMEAVGKTFHSFTAHFTQRKYTAVLQEFDLPESGEFYYQRAKDGSALLRQELKTPGTRILTIKGGVATIYQPRIRQAQIVNLGEKKDKAEYLALGLGQPPSKLLETFDVTYRGVENVDDTPCSVLVLKPKDPKAAAYFSSITLWLSKSAALPVQQQLQEPNGDYLLVAFSGGKLNSKIPSSRFDQQLPKGVEIQRIQ